MYFAVLFYSIIGTLEKLKQEAADITKKVEETDVVMAEVEAVTDQYRPLSQSCSSIYFTMESLNLVSEPSLCASVGHLLFIESKSDLVYKIIFVLKS